MKTKYFDDKGKTLNYYMWFRLLDKNNKVIANYANAACYGAISGGTIAKNVAIVDVYRARNTLPYDPAMIARFIYDMNEMGFPVTFINDPKLKDYHFHFYTQDYGSKVHIMSAMTMLRALWESNMAKIADFYFQLMDADPGADKVETIQVAHKMKGAGANGGHSITYNGNGGNIDRETLFKRFQKNDGTINKAGLGPGICNTWKGADPAPFRPGCADCLYKRQNGIYP